MRAERQPRPQVLEQPRIAPAPHDVLVHAPRALGVEHLTARLDASDGHAEGVGDRALGQRQDPGRLGRDVALVAHELHELGRRDTVDDLDLGGHARHVDQRLREDSSGGIDLRNHPTTGPKGEREHGTDEHERVRLLHDTSLRKKGRGAVSSERANATPQPHLGRPRGESRRSEPPIPSAADESLPGARGSSRSSSRRNVRSEGILVPDERLFPRNGGLPTEVRAPVRRLLDGPIVREPAGARAGPLRSGSDSAPRSRGDKRANGDCAPSVRA
jgi:hypothetical protein